ncbi:MAG: hypothetical protein P0Y55_05390 [Candidatus Cohnella colombiensis]|uniref:Uncharacterized protein n=1 Tax=Candidatus Cohnella colombiensis TaxID=3121368 RepID=A0AA95JCR0_9BACL|nr:MAG: hypothetical protein P0Y55_05390 [Cohnella sp.]
MPPISYFDPLLFSSANYGQAIARRKLVVPLASYDIIVHNQFETNGVATNQRLNRYGAQI